MELQEETDGTERGGKLLGVSGLQRWRSYGAFDQGSLARVRDSPAPVRFSYGALTGFGVASWLSEIDVDGVVGGSGSAK